jgi:hypothetical protein
MHSSKVGNHVVKLGSLLAASAALGLFGCSANLATESSDSGNTAKVDEALSSWTTLTLRNGWRTAANSNVPAVGIVNNIITFRGALDGSQATSDELFCLSDSAFAAYRPTDVGFVPLRAALANGTPGGLIMSPNSQLSGDAGFCMSVSEDNVDANSEPGPNARALTSLEGVSYDKWIQTSTYLPSPTGWTANYPMRGSDFGASGSNDQNKQGAFVKLVNGFVRFEGDLKYQGGGLPIALFNLPANQGMIPGHAVYLPVSFSPPFGSIAGQLVIQPSGEVDIQGPIQSAPTDVALDGASFSMASATGAQTIPLASGWVANSARAVRVRNDNGVIRLEGAIKNGPTTTLGTLPTGMRPAKTINLVATALLYATPSVLSINPSGVIQVVSPALPVAQSGISFDGVSFGL